jgi:hypothetical protein
MDISQISILLFIFVTIFYFSSVPIFGKPELFLNPESKTLNEEDLITYYTACRPKLAIYFLVVIVTQFILNIIYLIDKCGGDAAKNVGSAALNTFIPWTLMFAVVLATLSAFPGFKTVFSDVVGYYMVSSESNELLSSMLIDTNVRDAIENTTDPVKKAQVSEAAEAILKIFGNKALLINQIYPDNFEKIWNLLRPLMKETMFENNENKEKLLALVVTRENVGEAMWYIYTAILVSSIVYYNLATKGCLRDVQTIKTNYNQYIQEKGDELSAQAQATAKAQAKSDAEAEAKANNTS